MSDPTCPNCGASFGPEVSNPKDPDKTFRQRRPCPACGWQPPPPQSVEPPEPPKKSEQQRRAPEAPSAGKSFSSGHTKKKS